MALNLHARETKIENMCCINYFMFPLINSPFPLNENQCFKHKFTLPSYPSFHINFLFLIFPKSYLIQNPSTFPFVGIGMLELIML